MNIHELNTKAITSPAWVGLDDGEDTYKLDLNATLSTIQTGVSSAETDATDALDRATTLQSQMATAQGDIAHNQDDIADLQSDLSSLDTRTTASLNNLQSEVDAVEEDVADLKSGFEIIGEDMFDGYPHPVLTAANGWRLNENDGFCSQNSAYKLVKYEVTAGQNMKIVSDDRFQFQNAAAVPATGTNNRVGTTYGAGTYIVIVPTGANHLIVSTLVSGSTAAVYDNSSKIDDLERSVIDVVPELRNGSVLNSGNLYGISNRWILSAENIPKITALFTRTLPKDGHLLWQIVGFSAEAEGMTASDAYSAGYHVDGTNSNKEITMPANKKDIEITAYLNSNDACYGVAVYAYYSDGTRITLRATTDQYIVRIRNSYYPEKEDNSIPVKVNNARHIKSGSGTPLTILHFSDLHSDTAALKRIIDKAESYGVTIDEKICTGDMVANTYTQISSWWDDDVLTCIGNHDSASYNSETGYNWTALSMADRDAYYIAPFESNWGITHTSGLSYYYKDYANQKVRLIVMDGMLYTNAGAEATAQTSWLENLLADAITNNLHVLIAIHAPHGGATAEVCSFSKYNEGIMPTYGDCNTPQAVIDAVAAKITAGLKFIGYLVGHTHQDNIWDAENDGKQLMYCVTCAAVAQSAQWVNSDQHRSNVADAFNLVTIDTDHTLVKIVRGGGADIDDHMRTRKAICYNYSTGEKVGEVL